MTKGAREADLPKVTQSGGVGALPVLTPKGHPVVSRNHIRLGFCPVIFESLRLAEPVQQPGQVPDWPAW